MPSLSVIVTVFPAGTSIVPSALTVTFSPSAGVTVVVSSSLVTVTELPTGALTVPSAFKVKVSPAEAVMAAPSGVSTTEPAGRVIVPSLPITTSSILPAGTITVFFSCSTLAVKDAEASTITAPLTKPGFPSVAPSGMFFSATLTFAPSETKTACVALKPPTISTTVSVPEMLITPA